MINHIQWKKIPYLNKKTCEWVKLLENKEVLKVEEFHKSFPEYKPTPLVNLSNLAKELGLGGIFIKDESYRFELNAFKVKTM